MSIVVIYATCTTCEFELSAQSLDGLDEKFKPINVHANAK